MRNATKLGIHEFELEGLASVPALRRILEVVAVDTLSLDNGIARSRTLIALVGTAAKPMEVGELEERISALEAALADREQPVPIFPEAEPMHGAAGVRSSSRSTDRW